MYLKNKTNKKMKKIIYILLVIALPISALSSTIDSLKIKKNIEIGVSYSPDICYRKLKSDENSKWISDIRDTMEVAKLGYTAGLNIVYWYKNNISFETGLLFSDKGEKTKKYSLGNFSSTKLPINNIDIHHYYYLAFPIKANYYFVNKKCKLFVTGGITTNLFLSQKNTSILGYSDRDSEKKTTKINSELSSINFSFLIGAGIDYPLSDKSNLKFEPSYSRSINSITSAPVKSYLSAIGFKLGVYFKL